MQALRESDRRKHEEPEPGEEAEGQRVAPALPEEPPRARQDTQPVEGGTATHLPPETDLIQKPKVQG